MQNKATEYVRKQLNLAEDEPLALQHWLRVLEGNYCFADMIGDVGQITAIKPDTHEKVSFNLTTGQPATEEDMKAFCEIVGI